MKKTVLLLVAILIITCTLGTLTACGGSGVVLGAEQEDSLPEVSVPIEMTVSQLLQNENLVGQRIRVRAHLYHVTLGGDYIALIMVDKKDGHIGIFAGNEDPNRVLQERFQELKIRGVEAEAPSIVILEGIFLGEEIPLGEMFYNSYGKWTRVGLELEKIISVQ